MKISRFPTPGYHGYNVKFSPHVRSVLACATSQNYGISGKGSLFVLQQVPNNEIQLTCKFDWPDGLFDVTWSELDQNILVSSSGDGSIQIWNIAKPQIPPVAVLRGHVKEVYGVDWSPTPSENLLLSASWDKSIKLWDPVPVVELTTFLGHDHIVYSAVWSPHSPGSFASVSGDTTLRLWDIRTPELPVTVIAAHEIDALSCDWCKYNPNILATCGVDGLIRGWDIRNSVDPVFQLIGHEYAVRRIKFSPFEESILASVSYDFSTRLWDWNNPEALEIHNLHTEFVYGLDFSLHVPGLIADCGWDSLVTVFESGSSPS